MWKRAVLAVVLALAVSPALASDARAGQALATAAVPAGGASNATRVAADVRYLSVRLASLEQKVDRLSPRASSPDEQQAAAQKERQTEFLKHVWAD